MSDYTTITIHRALWMDVLEVLICTRDWNDGKITGIAEPLLLKKHEPGTLIERPTLTLEMKEGQRLIDSLWDSGLRPSQGSGSAGSLKATERHLEDMRKLVFKE